MQMVPVNSSMIAAVGYDPETQEMQVQFANGSVYSYEGVLEDDATGLMSAASPGSYFHVYIKDAYPGVPI